LTARTDCVNYWQIQFIPFAKCKRGQASDDRTRWNQSEVFGRLGDGILRKEIEERGRQGQGQKGIGQEAREESQEKVTAARAGPE
jgi:hypothetical protein